MARDEMPAHVIIAEIVCSAGLMGLNFSFLLALPVQFGAGFQLLPMVLAEAVILLSMGLLAYVYLFVLFPQWTCGTAQRVLWTYIFTGIWFRLLAFCSVVVLLAAGVNWYVHGGIRGGMAPGPFIWVVFCACLALAAWGRTRRTQKDELFKENDERIRQQGQWFKTHFVNGILVRETRLGLKDVPSVILTLLVFLLIGLGCLVLGVSAVGRRDLFAVVPLLFGCALTVFPFYWLALLISQLRNKPLTIVALLEKDFPGAVAKKPDVLSGQRTILLLIGLFSLVPLAISSVQIAWGGFTFAVVAGGGGFIGLNIMREKLAKRQKVKPLDVADYEHARQRLARRGCDYGLILLIGGLLVVTLTPAVVAWGTGAEPVMRVWDKFAFPVWAWLMLAALSCWYERAVKPIWPDDLEPTPGLRITEIVTWPFQLFLFLNPWELLIRLRKRLNIQD